MSQITFLESLKLRAKQLKQDTLAVWYAALDSRTPWYAKAIAGLVTAYAFSPIDLVPDFVPIMGYLDDLILIPAGIALTLKLIPAEVMRDARVKAAEQEKRPVNWWVGALIILIWAVILFFVIRGIARMVIEYN
ncbi:MAG: DUF1232 domain-containing protein [Anaerolineaceae bacterium]|mgnify:CR=1 FL=1|nr:DUF1232 domain-containing protein [Anaerolineaceae bacterium]